MLNGNFNVIVYTVYTWNTKFEIKPLLEAHIPFLTNKSKTYGNNKDFLPKLLIFVIIVKLFFIIFRPKVEVCVNLNKIGSVVLRYRFGSVTTYRQTDILNPFLGLKRTSKQMR